MDTQLHVAAVRVQPRRSWRVVACFVMYCTAPLETLSAPLPQLQKGALATDARDLEGREREGEVR